MSGLHALAAELALRANFAELGEARCPASAETQRDGSGQASGASTETCEALEEGSEEAEDEDEEEEAGCLLGLSAAVGPGLDTDTGKRPRHRGGRTRGAQASVEAIRACQHLPLRLAAKQCNLGTTQARPCRADEASFKICCRKLGIKRWPYRKLKGLATTIETCRAAAAAERLPGGMPSAQHASSDCPAAWADRLEALQDSLRNRSTLGDLQLPAVVLQVSQWAVKRRYFARLRNDTGGATEGRPPPPPAAAVAALTAGTSAWASALVQAAGSRFVQTMPTVCTPVPKGARAPRARREGHWHMAGLHSPPDTPVSDAHVVN